MLNSEYAIPVLQGETQQDHYGMVWHGMAWYGMVWHGMARGAARGTHWARGSQRLVPYHAIPYHAIPCHTLPYHTNIIIMYYVLCMMCYVLCIMYYVEAHVQK